MKKRFLAMLLCLSVLLMACACAAETMEPPAIDPVSEEPASQVTLSEVNAESSTTQEPAVPSETSPAESEPEETISVEESDIELEPIQPVEPIQPIIPVEKETTLEKVLSFDIGIDGMMEYSFLFYDDPSVADIGIYGNAYTDGNGVFYQVDYNDIIRVNDGAKFPFVSWSQVFDIKICQNDFYVLRAGPTGLYSILYHYDISTGFETPTLKATYDNLPSGYLGLMGEMPVVLEQGKVYGVDGKLLNESNTPFIVEQSKNDSLTVQMQNNVLTIQQGDSYKCYVTALSASGTIVAETKKKTNGTIYTSYDRDGNVIARFFHDTHYGLSLPCSLDFRGGSDEILTVKTYRPFGATIGDQVFEKLVVGRVFFDVYGNAYYAAYYLDHCDIYTIDQGYSDVQFPVDEELQAGGQ